MRRYHENSFRKTSVVYRLTNRYKKNSKKCHTMFQIQCLKVLKTQIAMVCFYSSWKEIFLINYIKDFFFVVTKIPFLSTFQEMMRLVKEASKNWSRVKESMLRTILEEQHCMWLLRQVIYTIHIINDIILYSETN